MAKDSKNKSEKLRYELLFPRMLSIPVRAVIWLHGYFDARRGAVQVSREGYITSPYCKKLVDEADYRINAEWQECNGVMFEVRPKLVGAMRERDELERQIRCLPEAKSLALAEAASERSGDAFVSEHLAKKRVSRRLTLVEDEFSRRECDMRNALNELEAQVDEILAEYQDCRDIAETHERVVRVDYLARLSVYARGASRRLNIGASFINDRALTTRPREDNDRFFSYCMSGRFPSEALSGAVE